jgi:L-2-hydroxyglutarate oxidase LhgO
MDLQLGYSGIRPKVLKKSVLETDFLFNTEAEHRIPGYFEFLGIESPGITAAPSLAKMLADKLI